MTAEREAEPSTSTSTSTSTSLKPGSSKMETRKFASADLPERPMEPFKETADKVFHFLPSALERQPEKRAASGSRDWSAALDLITEASEAVRLAEGRTAAAEQYSQQLTQFYKDQGKVTEAKIVAAEKRAEVAELRATEAEEWLARLHDAIVGGFKGVVGSR